MCDQQRLRPACAYAQPDLSLCSSLEYSMSVKLLTEHHLEFLSLIGGCTGSYETTLVLLLEITCHGSYEVCLEKVILISTPSKYTCMPIFGLIFFLVLSFLVCEQRMLCLSGTVAQTHLRFSLYAYITFFL